MLGLNIGVSLELCLSCTYNSKLDEILDFIDNYLGINLCLAKIDGFYYPLSGRLQVSSFSEIHHGWNQHYVLSDASMCAHIQKWPTLITIEVWLSVDGLTPPSYFLPTDSSKAPGRSWGS